MSLYSRGAGFERQLVSEFWARGWASLRAAGSGTRKEPVPDVVALKCGRIIIVECKTTRKDRLSLKTAILSLAEFTKVSGGEAYIAIRFFRQEPRFYDIRNLMEKEDYTITDKDEHMSLDQITGQQERL
ncbi:MAG: Holliday junction resolvase Hjc [Candidatus Altiarchaeota archaeon]